MEDRQNWTVEDLTAAVADTDRYAGGGAVAAMSLAGAAATIELVARLSARRKDIQDDERSRLENLASRSSLERMKFLALIDDDLNALQELMLSQRESRKARRSGDPVDLERAAIRSRAALERAIQVPLEAATHASSLLDDLVGVQSLAVPFTMSDFAAAAATLKGGIFSMLLMAEVNVRYLEDTELQNELATQIESMLESVEHLASRVVNETREVIGVRSVRGGE